MVDTDIDNLPASKKVLHIEAQGTPIESVGSFYSISNGLGFTSENELKDYIEGQVVLDVGSGVGGLARESSLRKIPTKIVSMNPRFSLAGHLQTADEFYSDPSTVQELESLLQREIPPSEVEEAAHMHKKSALAGFSHEIPIKSGVITRIIDHKGAIYHMVCEDKFTDFGMETNIHVDEAGLKKTIDEYLRVLAPGGIARMGGLPTQEILEELKKVLDNMQIPYQIYQAEDYRVGEYEAEENKYQYAIEIRK